MVVKKKQFGVGVRLGGESRLRAGKDSCDGQEGTGPVDRALEVSGFRRFW